MHFEYKYINDFNKLFNKNKYSEHTREVIERLIRFNFLIT